MSDSADSDLKLAQTEEQQQKQTTLADDNNNDQDNIQDQNGITTGDPPQQKDIPNDDSTQIQNTFKNDNNLTFAQVSNPAIYDQQQQPLNPQFLKPTQSPKLPPNLQLPPPIQSTITQYPFQQQQQQQYQQQRFNFNLNNQPQSLASTSYPQSNASQLAYYQQVNQRRQHIQQQGGITNLAQSYFNNITQQKDATGPTSLPGGLAMPAIHQQPIMHPTIAPPQQQSTILTIPNYVGKTQRGTGTFSTKMAAMIAKERGNPGDDDDDDDGKDDSKDNGNGGNNGGNNGNNNGGNGPNGPNQNDFTRLGITLADNQKAIIKLLNKKNKKQINWLKLPKCDVKYYGKLKNGEHDDLVRKFWDFVQWCNVRKIPTERWAEIWKGEVLEMPAKREVFRQGKGMNTIDELLELLYGLYPPKPKIFEKLKNLYEFKYEKRTSMTAHIMRYGSIIREIIEEQFIWENITQPTRLPDLPSYQKQYEILLYSIKSLEKLYDKVRDLQYNITPNINSTGYQIGPQDINNLAENMRIAETILYPKRELTRFNMKATIGSYSTRKHTRKPRQRDVTGTRKYRYNKQKSRRDRRKQQDRNRQRYQKEKGSFKGKCFACNGSHPLRVCPDKEKKTEYCRENKLCLFCGRGNHQLKYCRDHKKWKKKKEAGTMEQKSKFKPKSKPKMNRKAIRYMTVCKYGEKCAYKHNCYYLHQGDHELATDSETDSATASETETESDSATTLETDSETESSHCREYSLMQQERLTKWERTELNTALEASKVVNSTKLKDVIKELGNLLKEKDEITLKKVTLPTGMHYGRKPMKRPRLHKAKNGFYKPCRIVEQAKDESIIHFPRCNKVKCVKTDTLVPYKLELIDTKHSKRSRKEQMHVKTSLERVNVNYYKLATDQIPSGSTVKLYLRQNKSDGMVKYPALLDTGSTISAITPRIAEKFRQALKFKDIKGKPFDVENGGRQDETFSGDYLEIPTLKPNTKTFVKVKYLIMPHNECSFGEGII